LVDLAPRNGITRTLKIKTRGVHSGASFTIDLHGQQWLVTARHIVDGVPPTEITVVTQAGVEVGGLVPVPVVSSTADVAVFDLGGRTLTSNDPLTPHARDFYLSQNVFFLGFPFGLHLQGIGETYPLVKRASISGWAEDNGIQDHYYLDGINNPGFSGGPVIFNRIGDDDDWRLLGVIHGYRFETIPVDSGHGTVKTNTGIIVAYSIQHAVDAINAYVSP
jgi:hypothetical protein